MKKNINTKRFFILDIKNQDCKYLSLVYKKKSMVIKKKGIIIKKKRGMVIKKKNIYSNSFIIS